LHPEPLAEPDMNLSAHPAPIKQTRQLNGVSVARIEVLPFPVASVMRPLDPTPSLQPHYEPSSLLRVGPPQCSASVHSPHVFTRLGFSLHIRATGSCSSTRQPASASRHLYASRRPLSHQASRGLVPGELGGIHAVPGSGVDGTTGTKRDHGGVGMPERLSLSAA
jgi:hypothetical protein